jgi:hypothetical protein
VEVEFGDGFVGRVAPGELQLGLDFLALRVQAGVDRVPDDAVRSLRQVGVDAGSLRPERQEEQGRTDRRRLPKHRAIVQKSRACGSKDP